MGLDHVDVLIVGAGLSGVGAAHHLQKHCPTKSFAILEARETLGGTWDLFRYPGIRSDSDMYTLGYNFRPWTRPKAIADGPSILAYVKDTARESGIDRHIRFQHRAVRASWSSAEAVWTVDIERGPDRSPGQIICNFLFLCAGYYKFEKGYAPDFPGSESFTGRIVHPQHWPEDLDYAGRNVVIIGSGATAVTLAPEMAKTAGHVTVLQRTPTYIVARPDTDPIANALRRLLPASLAYGLTRWKNVLLSMYFYRLTRTRPERVKKFLLDGVRQELGPEFDVHTHFEPPYNPWDQRLCLAPNGDFFAAIRNKSVSMVTDGVAGFTPEGVALKSGGVLKADVVVTATGLDLQVLGGVELWVDGRRVDPARTFNYRGVMFSDVPNLANAFGYTNASWTLKCDLICAYICRLLNHMDRTGMRQATPRVADATLQAEPWVDFSSTYIQRTAHLFPKQGDRKPWRLNQNYVLDLMALRYGPMEDGVIEFSAPAAQRAPERLMAAAQ